MVDDKMRPCMCLGIFDFDFVLLPGWNYFGVVISVMDFWWSLSGWQC
jgi:hypothetical protein